MAKKKKPTIYIKPSHEGLFTQWANEHGHEGMTDAAIEEGLASRSAITRKRAQFAKNAQSWKH